MTLFCLTFGKITGFKLDRKPVIIPKHITDKYDVDTIFDLFSSIIKIGLIGAVVLVVTRVFKFKKSSGVKNELQNMQAKVSQMRLSLKGKVKRKSNVFRAAFKGPLTEGDMIDNALRQLSDNAFEKGEDFQDYFDLSRKIVHYINVETNGDVASHTNSENDFMCADFKTEMDIVRLMKEMCTLSSKINNKIEEHNRINPTQKMSKCDSLIFRSMNEINKIFEDKNLESKPVDATDSESAKAS